MKRTIVEVLSIDCPGDARVSIGFTREEQRPVMLFRFPGDKVKLVELPWKPAEITAVRVSTSIADRTPPEEASLPEFDLEYQ